MAYQVRDVLDAMALDAGGRLAVLRVDGGAAVNDALLQFQADILGVPVERPQVTETTALGAAFLAGLATGVWSSTDEVAATWGLDRRFEPAMERRERARLLARWRRAVERARGWAGPDELRTLAASGQPRPAARDFRTDVRPGTKAASLAPAQDRCPPSTPRPSDRRCAPRRSTSDGRTWPTLAVAVGRRREAGHPGCPGARRRIRGAASVPKPTTWPAARWSHGVRPRDGSSGPGQRSSDDQGRGPGSGSKSGARQTTSPSSTVGQRPQGRQPRCETESAAG